MQQTVDVDVTKEETVETIPVSGSFYFYYAAVEMALADVETVVAETIPAYGLFYFYSAAADAATDLAATTTAVETAVSGLSFCYSAVADLEADPTTVVAVAMDSEMAAANPSKKFRLV